MVREKYRRLQSSTKPQIYPRVLRSLNLICLSRRNIVMMRVLSENELSVGRVDGQREV